MKSFSITTLCISIFLLISCSEDDKATDIIGDQGNSGAFIRTLNFNNSDLILDDLSSTFSVDLEAQLEQSEALLENIEVYALFKDNSLDNGDQSSTEILIKTIDQNLFTIGPNALPRTTLTLTYAELTSLTSIPIDLLYRIPRGSTSGSKRKV
ncbi:MAG: hypothetical protein ACI9Y7_002452 [Dokdonia sp.]|jgi:hypothetical protein